MNLEGVRGETGTNTHNVVLELWRRMRRLENSFSLLQINNEFQITPEQLISFESPSPVTGVMPIYRQSLEPTGVTQPSFWIDTSLSNNRWWTHSGVTGDSWAFWKADAGSFGTPDPLISSPNIYRQDAAPTVTQPAFWIDTSLSNNRWWTHTGISGDSWSFWKADPAAVSSTAMVGVCAVYRQDSAPTVTQPAFWIDTSQSSNRWYSNTGTSGDTWNFWKTDAEIP